MEVTKLAKEEIDAYSEFIVKVFDYHIDSTSMEECINHNKVLIIKEEDKIVASLTYEERKDYVKNKKFYFISYFGVVKEYRREGLGTMLFDYLKEEKIYLKEYDKDYFFKTFDKGLFEKILK